MTGKRPREESDGPVSKIAAVNPNWAQLKAKLNSYPRRRKSSETNADVRTSGKKPAGIVSHGETEKPVTTMDGTSSTLGSLKPMKEDLSVTDALAIDCEMVGVGSDGSRNALARVTLVNVWGNAVYDEFVRPLEFVTNFRSNISGVRAHNLRKAEDLWTVQKKVSELIKGRVLVGHALHNDLKVLFLSHPKKDVRDTSVYKPLRSKLGRPRALRDLAAEILGVKIQENEHNSAEDARAAMFIYQKFKKEWEKSIRYKGKLLAK
ncbi:uncharacterized protein LOC131068816 isoform X1 [Cryptomeria japonica]|uniref:uncharacterized protein LOC131068816 isoform X1 n=1 Tax=Cryptomeria japonica TaxID=3369 RepID=UPI0025ACDC4C|nr:uncharacterized protein LOC131068816 isoform X1 [Cryptomeria japonica]